MRNVVPSVVSTHILSEQRTASVYNVVRNLRELHQELQRSITWDGLRAVLLRDGVLLASAPLARPAKLLVYEGVAVILVDSARPARHLWYTAHEYGHFKLHVSSDHYECCYHMDDLLAGDPREHEADLFADLLMYGPITKPEHV